MLRSGRCFLNCATEPLLACVSPMLVGISIDNSVWVVGRRQLLFQLAIVRSGDTTGKWSGRKRYLILQHSFVAPNCGLQLPHIRCRASHEGSTARQFYRDTRSVVGVWRSLRSPKARFGRQFRVSIFGSNREAKIEASRPEDGETVVLFSMTDRCTSGILIQWRCSD